MAIIRSEVVEPGDLATGRPPILEFRTDDGRGPYFAVPGTSQRLTREEARAYASGVAERSRRSSALEVAHRKATEEQGERAKGEISVSA